MRLRALRSHAVPGRDPTPNVATRLRQMFHRSEDQHRIAEGVEAIALGDRDLVEAPRLLDTGEGHHEREQGRAREVEVRQQVVDAPELEAWGDEQLGATGERRAAG